MKARIIEENEELPIGFLGTHLRVFEEQDTKVIVLTTGKQLAKGTFCGIILSSNTKSWNTGDYSEDLSCKFWKPYKGTLTIELEN